MAFRFLELVLNSSFRSGVDPLNDRSSPSSLLSRRRVFARAAPSETNLSPCSSLGRAKSFGTTSSATPCSNASLVRAFRSQAVKATH